MGVGYVGGLECGIVDGDDQVVNEEGMFRMIFIGVNDQGNNNEGKINLYFVIVIEQVVIECDYDCYCCKLVFYCVFGVDCVGQNCIEYQWQ